jgi:hypothetical protein
MPPCIFIPRILSFDLDNAAEDNGAELALTMYKKTSNHALASTKPLVASIEDKSLVIKLNPLYSMLKVSEMPQKPKDLDGQVHEEEDEDEMSDSEEDEEEKELSEKYIVNGLFGSEDNSSMLRVILTTKSQTAIKVCDQVMAWRTSKIDDFGLFKEHKTV